MYTSISTVVNIFRVRVNRLIIRVSVIVSINRVIESIRSIEQVIDVDLLQWFLHCGEVDSGLLLGCRQGILLGRRALGALLLLPIVGLVDWIGCVRPGLGSVYP